MIAVILQKVVNITIISVMIAMHARMIGAMVHVISVLSIVKTTMLVLQIFVTWTLVVKTLASAVMTVLLVLMTVAIRILVVSIHPLNAMIMMLVPKTGVAQLTDANTKVYLAMITMNVRSMTVTTSPVVLTLRSTVTIKTCVLMIAVILNAVVDMMKSLVKITMLAQMIIVQLMMDVFIMMLSVMIVASVRLIPVVKKKVVSMYRSAVMIIMLVPMIHAIKILDV